MSRSFDPYDRAVRSLSDSDRYDFSGESEYSRERSDPYPMVEYMIDRGHDFRGRGPKGYRRSDERIREEVCETLAHDPDIDASEIEIDIVDSCIYLKGSVDSKRTKRLAELTIENISGIRDVFNMLKII